MSGFPCAAAFAILNSLGFYDLENSEDEEDKEEDDNE